MLARPTSGQRPAAERAGLDNARPTNGLAKSPRPPGHTAAPSTCGRRTRRPRAVLPASAANPARATTYS